MAARRSRPETAYTLALAGTRRKGVVASTDAELMAGLLDSTLQIMAGALSPELVWNGAQKAGLTAARVMELVTGPDLPALDNLMWS